MLYLDYSRADGEWIPNEHGGNENLGALRFVKRLNELVYDEFPDVQTVAEESTAWPMVSRPTNVGGLGFGMKWDMGWMHDTLRYFDRAPIHRSHHQDELTFRMVYAFNENFVLPLSHDEVVHGKGSLLAKMPGDEWQQLANLRTLFGYMYGQPGKKLLFMGSELALRHEWDHDRPLPWEVLDHPGHLGMQRWVAHLNHLHRDEPALSQLDFAPHGFQWIDASDAASSVLSFIRRPAADDARPVLVVCNFTPVPRQPYVVGVPRLGRWLELANSDAQDYGGSGWGNLGGVKALEVPSHGLPASLELALPPLAVLFLAPEP
jgi:1,4-alpha-glucan branching enzyme